VAGVDATVVSVGLATIAAAIGAGASEFIFRGLAMVNNQVTAGAVPAAVLASADAG
jgi:ABC-type proline/glycine betaine transport system permease subunit